MTTGLLFRFCNNSASRRSRSLIRSELALDRHPLPGRLMTDAELVQAFDGLDDLRDSFPVNNPRASIADMKRHLLRKPERFVCYGGYKSFYMDWNFDIWRCDAWQKPMCSVWDFAQTPLVRDGCTACIADCYRDSSVMLHFAVSLGDALDYLGKGQIAAALKTIMDTRNLESLQAVVGNAPVISRLAKLG